VRAMLGERIAVIGAGPAGSFAAAALCSAGRQVLLFDEKLAWEKPCGGGLTDKALARWPFLHEAAVERNLISDCELIAPSGAKVSFALDKQIAIFSRLALNGLLLGRAHNSGATVLRERIVSVEAKQSGWLIRSATSSYEADFVVIATGARNPFRNLLSSPLGSENFIVAAGYYIPGTSPTVKIRFVEGLQGYIWVFPRSDHFSTGICGRMQGKSTVELRRLLEAYLPDLGLSHEAGRFYAHILPSFTPDTLHNLKCGGENWALLGDAAGLVDAITGEGLYYALRSAELFSEAFLSGHAPAYSDAVQHEIVPELARAARIADRFYAGDWLGGRVLERMIQLTGSSMKFRQLMRDLFSGTQEYANLKRRVYESLPRIAAEALVSTIWNSGTAAVSAID
jgi:geranylgeranyl diphosphate/geranylgeranyl-bacteriochlorophyllide a reductase